MNARPRMLFVDQFGDVGGGQQILVGLLERAVERGWDAGVAVPAGGGVEARAARAGARVFPLAVPLLSKGSKNVRDVVKFGAGLVAGTRALRLAAKTFSPDIVYVNGGRVLLQAVAARTGRPIVFHLHSCYGHAGTRLLVGAALRSRAVARVVVPSHFLAAWAIKTLRVQPARVRVVHNWVNDEFFRGEPGRDQGVKPGEAQKPRGENGVQAGATGMPRVGVVGRIYRDKGQALAAQAVCSLKETGIEARLVVAGIVDRRAGGNSYWQEVQAAARPLGDGFVYLGEVDDVPRVLAGLAVALVPSVAVETFGLAAAEAMAAGVPTVVTPVGALPEVVGEAGIVAETCTPEAVAAALRRLLEDEPLRERLSREGRERARALYSRTVQTDAILGLLEEVMADAGRQT